jgi:hypothetical protein
MEVYELSCRLGKSLRSTTDADFRSWEQLQSAESIPACHRLQFLQMACGKLTKAHLCHAGSNPSDLQSSHAYIAKNLPIIALQHLPPKSAGWALTQLRHLAQEIACTSRATRRSKTLTTANIPGRTRAVRSMCLSIGHLKRQIY